MVRAEMGAGEVIAAAAADAGGVALAVAVGTANWK